MNKLYVYGIIAWFALVVLAIINGIVRETWYKTLVGDLAAHQISTFTFIIGLFLVTFIFIYLLGHNYSATSYWKLGAIWLALTVLFEFGFGHFVMGNSWERLLADYNVMAGHIWIAVLIATTCAPRVVSHVFTREY